jgi:hypothetical protein
MQIDGPTIAINLFHFDGGGEIFFKKTNELVGKLIN